jgi:putative intracellular protease/amidase
MQIAIPLYEGVTALDAIGPYEVLSRIPDAETRFVGLETGPLRTEQGSNGPTFLIEHTLDDVPSPDIVVVPGGYGNRALLEPGPMIDWLRAAHETTTWTTSVCTGSLLLAAAGILDGVHASTHWLAHDTLRDLGAVPVSERVVRRGKVMTAAGVSAGIDMGLALLAEIGGPMLSQAVQLAVEYDPQPPFDAGAPHKAPDEVVDLVRTVMEASAAQAR